MLHEYLNSINCCAHQKLISLLLNILSTNFLNVLFFFNKSKTMSSCSCLDTALQNYSPIVTNPKS